MMSVYVADRSLLVLCKPVGVVGTKLSFLSISVEPGSRAILLWFFPEIVTFLGYAYYGQACFSNGKGRKRVRCRQNLYQGEANSNTQLTYSYVSQLAAKYIQIREENTHLPMSQPP